MLAMLFPPTVKGKDALVLRKELGGVLISLSPNCAVS